MTVAAFGAFANNQGRDVPDALLADTLTLINS